MSNAIIPREPRDEDEGSGDGVGMGIMFIYVSLFIVQNSFSSKLRKIER